MEVVLTYFSFLIGVELTLKDLVAFYLKPETREQAEKAALAVADKKSRSGSESESGGKDKNNNEVTKGTKKRSSVEKLKAIGCNVMVLKHNDAEASSLS